VRLGRKREDPEHQERRSERQGRQEAWLAARKHWLGRAFYHFWPRA
jgi:hypothetical protein